MLEPLLSTLVMVPVMGKILGGGLGAVLGRALGESPSNSCLGLLPREVLDDAKGPVYTSFRYLSCAETPGDPDGEVECPEDDRDEGPEAAALLTLGVLEGNDEGCDKTLRNLDSLHLPQ